MSKSIALSGMFIGAVGIFFGFFYLGKNPQLSLEIVTVSTVGLVGVLAFVRHLVFHKADAKRMGWETDRPEWAYEVGFANLAFGFMGLFAVFAKLGVQAQALTVLGYAVYLMQAAFLHGNQYFSGNDRSPEKLWRVVIGTGSFSAMMLFFSINALLR
jgi:uncharacterized membrane protein